MSKTTISATDVAKLFATEKNLSVYDAFPSTLRTGPARHIEGLINQFRTPASHDKISELRKKYDLRRHLHPVANNVERPVALNLAQILVSRI